MNISKVESLKGFLKLETEHLRGKLKPTISLRGIVQSEQNLSGTISIIDDYAEYKGNYIVVPKTESQTLPTIDKVMSRDMTIASIPYYEVQNEKGGNTITIGGA